MHVSISPLPHNQSKLFMKVNGDYLEGHLLFLNTYGRYHTQVELSQVAQLITGLSKTADLNALIN